MPSTSSKVAPVLTAEQRQAGYARSLELRRARAALKARLTDGSLTFAEALDHPDAQAMPIADLLRALPFVGVGKTAKMLKRADIPADKRVAGCGVRQRAALLAQL